jgi:CRISPR-associated protein Csm1
MQNKVQLYFSSILYELHRCYPSVAKSLVLPMADDTKMNVEKASNLALGNSSAKLSGKPQLFRSVMEQLSLKKIEDREIKPYKYSIPCKLLDLATFPQKEVHTNDNVIGQITQFLTEVESRELLKSNSEFALNTFLTLLEIYTTSIAVGSTLKDEEWLPDVSLFHHLKMVSVFTVCLSTENKEDFLLIGGDISGIQSFIYDIVSKNASKNLKGRSFYLQLLVDTVLQRLLKSLQLSKAHIIYASGGGFFVLAPNTKFIKDELAKIEKELSDKIFEAHKTSLYLAFDFEIIPQNQLLNHTEKGISESWKQLLEKLNAKKRRRYSNKLISSFDSFFEPQEVGGNRERDAITNEEFTDEEMEEIERLRNSDNFKGQLVRFLDRNDEELIGKPVKLSTYEQIRLGESLSGAQYWIISEKPLKLNEGYFETCEMGVFHYFLDEKDFQKFHNLLSEVDINLFNKTQIPKLPINNCGLNFTFYGGNEAPQIWSEKNKRLVNKTFDELAGNGSFKRLGILRMDVDNLGQIFQKGFNSNEMTLARYSTLSSRLDWFFKGYLNTLRDKEDVLILYSGGDDLFILGKWNKVLNLAKMIRDKFQELTCFNDELSISGGMALVPDKFPIKQGATAAGKAEKKAKSYQYFFDCPKGKSTVVVEKMIKGKNAFCFIDMPLSWEREFTMANDLKTDLRFYLDKGVISEGLLDKIQLYRNMQKVQTERNENPKWMWLTAYDFAQIKRRIKNNDPQADNAKGFLEELKVSTISNTFRANKMLIEINNSDSQQRTFLQMLELAATWTNFERRTEKENTPTEGVQKKY